MIQKKGSANWKGSLTEGTGTISTESGVLDEVNYGFKKRFEGGFKKRFKNSFRSVSPEASREASSKVQGALQEQGSWCFQEEPPGCFKARFNASKRDASCRLQDVVPAV